VPRSSPLSSKPSPPLKPALPAEDRARDALAALLPPDAASLVAAVHARDAASSATADLAAAVGKVQSDVATGLLPLAVAAVAPRECQAVAHVATLTARLASRASLLLDATPVKGKRAKGKGHGEGVWPCR
jgi:hypothetical protein